MRKKIAKYVHKYHPLLNEKPVHILISPFNLVGFQNLKLKKITKSMRGIL